MRRISLNKFVDITSTNPAKIFGLYPKKGVLAEGSDADIVFIDPDREVTITKSILHENVDYTAYEGMKVKGWLKTVARLKNRLPRKFQLRALGRKKCSSVFPILMADDISDGFQCAHLLSKHFIIVSYYNV